MIEKSAIEIFKQLVRC